MWKPTNQPQSPARPGEPERPTTSTPSAPAMTASEPVSAPRPVTTTTADQATIGKSLVIKGEVTGSESLYIDGRVEGSINLSGNRVTVGRNGVVSANINAREIVVLGKVRGNLTASDRVDIRSDGSLTGDVIAARISIEDGAFFKGGIDIRKGGQPQQQPAAEGQRRRQGWCSQRVDRSRGRARVRFRDLKWARAGTHTGARFSFRANTPACANARSRSQK